MQSGCVRAVVGRVCLISPGKQSQQTSSTGKIAMSQCFVKCNNRTLSNDDACSTGAFSDA